MLSSGYYILVQCMYLEAVGAATHTEVLFVVFALWKNTGCKVQKKKHWAFGAWELGYVCGVATLIVFTTQN